MKRTIIASVFVLVLAAGQAAAADGQFSLFAGYLDPGELTLENVEESFEFRGTSVYGLRIEFDFLKLFGVEQNLAFSPRLFDSALFPDEAGEVRGLLYSSNLVINLPVGRFVPYVTGGIGLMTPWGTDIDVFDTTFAGNYGGGIKLNRLFGPVGLRFDVRGWRTADIDNQGGINIFEATGAVTFTW